MSADFTDSLSDKCEFEIELCHVFNLVYVYLLCVYYAHIFKVCKHIYRFLLFFLLAERGWPRAAEDFFYEREPPRPKIASLSGSMARRFFLYVTFVFLPALGIFL